MENNNAILMSQVTEEIAHSIMPRVQGLIALLDHSANVEDDEDVGAAFNILQDVQRDLQEAHERAAEIGSACATLRAHEGRPAREGPTLERE